MARSSTYAGVLILSLLAFGCTADTNPAAPSAASMTAAVAATDSGSSTSAARPAQSCVNVAFQGTADLGLRPFNGQMLLGGLPTPLKIGDIQGTLASVVLSQQPSGSQGQGAAHIVLQHDFTSDVGTFQTRDRAVCAPAGRDALVCRVNDVMEIVGGTGVFANATGFLLNHGIITLNPTFPPTGTLTVNLRGRVCGDGL